MGAVVAAATHAPVSAIIILFELTQTIDIIPALMTACVISTLVAQLSYRDSIYTVKLRRQGIDLFEAKNPNVLKDLSVRDVMVLDPVVIPASADFKTVLDLVVSEPPQPVLRREPDPARTSARSRSQENSGDSSTSRTRSSTSSSPATSSTRAIRPSPTTSTSRS